MEKIMHIERKQTLGEEIANSISHGVGVLIAVAVTPLLLIKAIPLGAGEIIGVSIFASTMIVLYLSSTLYHAFPPSKTKRVFRIFDHSAIYLLIAGTYTPFTLGILRGPWGWSLFGIIWTLAIAGVVIKSVQKVNAGIISTVLYLAMGWLGLIAAKPLYNTLPVTSLIWLFIGGAMYSLGVFFYAYDNRVRYNHFIWHLFVLGGTCCHVAAILYS